MEIPGPNEYAKDQGYQNPFPPRWEKWLSAVREAILTSQPTAGRHVRIDEHHGKGTVINVDDTSARRGGGPATGVCCHDDASCTITTETDCDGIWYAGEDCESIDCTQGACCDEDGSCTLTTPEECSGTFQGRGTTCVPNPCAGGEICCPLFDSFCSNNNSSLSIGPDYYSQAIFDDAGTFLSGTIEPDNMPHCYNTILCRFFYPGCTGDIFYQHDFSTDCSYITSCSGSITCSDTVVKDCDHMSLITYVEFSAFNV
jgi:hypothetical protein